mgnify:CR=1 FL=1
MIEGTALAVVGDAARVDNLVDAVRGVGARWVRQIDRTYDVAALRDTLREALTTKETGPKIIVASSEFPQTFSSANGRHSAHT